MFIVCSQTHTHISTGTFYCIPSPLCKASQSYSIEVMFFFSIFQKYFRIGIFRQFLFSCSLNGDWTKVGILLSWYHIMVGNVLTHFEFKTSKYTQTCLYCWRAGAATNATASQILPECYHWMMLPLTLLQCCCNDVVPSIPPLLLWHYCCHCMLLQCYQIEWDENFTIV